MRQARKDKDCVSYRLGWKKPRFPSPSPTAKIPDDCRPKVQQIWTAIEHGHKRGQIGRGRSLSCSMVPFQKERVVATPVQRCQMASLRWHSHAISTTSTGRLYSLKAHELRHFASPHAFLNLPWNDITQGGNGMGHFAKVPKPFFDSPDVLLHLGVVVTECEKCQSPFQTESLLICPLIRGGNGMRHFAQVFMYFWTSPDLPFHYTLLVE